MNSEDNLKLTRAMSLLRRVHVRSQRLTDMDHREFHLLVSIASRQNSAGGITIGELAEMYNVSKPAISNLIKEKEEKGFVERQTDKSDRRVVWVKLTDAGKAELERAKRYWEELGEKIEQKFGEKNLDLFITLINRLAEVVNEIISEERANEKSKREFHQ